MKKILQIYELPKLRAARKRFERSLKSSTKNKTKKFSSRRRPPDSREKTYAMVEAPSKLDLYSPKNHTAFVDFLKNLRRSVSANKITTINLKHCNRITAAAGLLLIAEVDRLTKAYPDNKVKCINPESPNHGPGKESPNLVESALNQIGFYSLIKQKNNKKAIAGSVKKWRQLSGDSADGTLANSLLQTLKDVVPSATLRKLYRGAIEAIANCVEHAYPSVRQDGLNINDPRWWMLVGVDESNLSIIVCDLGVGIPNTLPTKHEESLLNHIKSMLGITDVSDAEMIRISTHIRETRTKLSNRGKGGRDFRSMPKNFPTSYLAIRSNSGAFFITGRERNAFKDVSSRKFVPNTDKTESMIDHSKSIYGTLIEWAIPIKDLQND